MLDARTLTALTIAGFDPSSGAGVTADLAVFAAHGIFGTSAITALTVQSTIGVQAVELVTAPLLRDTLACLYEDLPPDGIKIGMLGDVEQVRTVVDFLQPLRNASQRPFVVLDPVIRSSSGADLLTTDGLAVMRSDLLPLVDCITPNTVELAVLSGLQCGTEEEIESAARELADQYRGLSVVATGGHLARPDDLLLHDGRIFRLHGERIETNSTHGTGCAFSSAVLCRLMSGETYQQTVTSAKGYVVQAMRSAIRRGKGKGPMNLLWPLRDERKD